MKQKIINFATKYYLKWKDESEGEGIPLSKQKIITIRIGDFVLKAFQSCKGEKYMKMHPEYDRNLPQLAKCTFEKYNAGTIIDVGANIGDTIAMLRTYGIKNEIIAIEGDNDYFRLLEENVNLFGTNIKAYNVFLGEKTEVINSGIFTEKGTLRLSKVDKKTHSIKIFSFDELATIKDIKDVIIFKTDTDGYDLKVLKGAENFIKKYTPVLFIEYDTFFFSEHEDDGITSFKNLNSFGYVKAIFYDNYGRFLISVDADNYEQINQLTRYTNDRRGKFEYFDIAIFHKKDLDLYNKVLNLLMKQM